MKEKWNLELSKYIKQGEPTQVEKTRNWETAIGLQEVDGLKPSKYLVETAKELVPTSFFFFFFILVSLSSLN